MEWLLALCAVGGVVVGGLAVGFVRGLYIDNLKDELNAETTALQKVRKERDLYQSSSLEHDRTARNLRNQLQTSQRQVGTQAETIRMQLAQIVERDTRNAMLGTDVQNLRAVIDAKEQTIAVNENAYQCQKKAAEAKLRNYEDRCKRAGEMVGRQKSRIEELEGQLREVARCRDEQAVTIEQLQQEQALYRGNGGDRARELLSFITKHRDAKGHDRCWLNDCELYVAAGLDPEDPALPPLPEFIRCCTAYWVGQSGESAGPVGAVGPVGSGGCIGQTGPVGCIGHPGPQSLLGDPYAAKVHDMVKRTPRIQPLTDFSVEEAYRLVTLLSDLNKVSFEQMSWMTSKGFRFSNIDGTLSAVPHWVLHPAGESPEDRMEAAQMIDKVREAIQAAVDVSSCKVEVG